MKKIFFEIKQMNIFQKIQLLSTFIPLYSFAFVVFTTYIVCWKKKRGFSSFAVCSPIYFLILFLLEKIIPIFLIKYIICVIVSFIGNYFLVRIQRKIK